MAARNIIEIIIQARDEATAVLDRMGISLGGLGKAIGLVSAAWAALKAAQGAVDLGVQAAQTMRVENAFRSLAAQAGESADQMLEAMQRASRGTVAASDLMLAANRAMLLGVADTGDELAALMEVAAVRARAMGLSTKQAFDDIVTGIGRESALILDNLGIVIDLQGALEAYAERVGKSADELDSLERKQAIVNAVMEQSRSLLASSRDVGADYAASMERASAAIEDAKQALGELFAPAVAVVAEQIADAARAAADGLEAVGEAMAGATDPVDRYNMVLAETEGELHGLRVVLAQLKDANLSDRDIIFGDWWWQMPDTVRGNRQAMIEWVEAQIQARTATARAASALVEFRDKIGQTWTEMRLLAMNQDLVAQRQEEQARAARQAEAAQARLVSQIRALIDAERELAGWVEQAGNALRSSFRGVADVLGAEEAVRRYRATRGILEQMVQQWQEMGVSQDEIDFRMAAYVESIREANSELERAAEKTGGLDDATRKAQQAFEDLVGKVKGVLSQALDPGVGVDPEDILPREDAINEDARRLADVAVKGFESPWVEYLRNKFPDLFAQAGDIRQVAARILRDFQEGLVPELIDKERAKERVRRILLGEAKMDELAREIAAELSAEMGGQFSMAQIQAAAGAVLGTEGTGAEQGRKLAQNLTGAAVQALSDGNLGARVAATVDAQIRANLEIMRTSGQTAGTAWGEGFLSVVGQNVPSRLIEILVSLVTPAVWERLAAERSLQGATR